MSFMYRENKKGPRTVPWVDTQQNRSPVKFYSIYNKLLSEAKKRMYPFPGVVVGGISGMNLVQVCRWASSYPPYKCILSYGKSIPITVYTIMEDNKKCSLFPFKLNCLMQKIVSTVKCWIINWFLSESNKITWWDKGQVVRLSTAGDWMKGYKCIFEMKSWPIDV